MLIINTFTSLLGFEKTLSPMRAANAKAALSKQYRYSLYDENGNETEKKIMREAEFIAYSLQSGRKPETSIEHNCGKCQVTYCPGNDLCSHGKTVYSMSDGRFSTNITKTGYDFANFLINFGLTTFDAVQAKIDSENEEKEKKAQEAVRIEQEQKAAKEAEQQAETEYKEWLREAIANYGCIDASENEKILIQKEIFLDVQQYYHQRVIDLLVCIDNIDNPRCRRDIISRLHNHNPASIRTFEYVTGVKLAKSHKERITQLEVISKADYGAPKQYKPRKTAVPAEYNDIFYVNRRKGDGGIEFVESRGRLWRYNGVDFFIQKDEKDRYKATEGRSGYLMTSNCQTLEELKKSVKSKIASIGDTFEKSINDVIEKYGISPLYAAK